MRSLQHDTEAHEHAKWCDADADAVDTAASVVEVERAVNSEDLPRYEGSDFRSRAATRLPYLRRQLYYSSGS